MSLRWTEEDLKAHEARRKAGRSKPLLPSEPSKRLAPGETKAGVMNKTEGAFAQGLEYQKRVGQIRRYWYESIRLRLAKRTTYTPDFVAERVDGKLIVYETKGRFIREDAMAKFKIAAEMYPCFEFYLCVLDKGKWTVTRY